MAPSRVVVVVPRRETRLHEYLQRSLACLADVEVVLDRRAATATPADERRRSSAEHDERELLLCSLVRCPGPPPTPPPAPAPPPARPAAPRTLLWPALRLENL